MRLTRTRNRALSRATSNEVISIPFQLPIPNLREAVDDFERHYISHILDKNEGRKGKTAEALGIDRKTLYLKMKKYGLAF
ncbi:response regulator containing CheY-like receiver [Candidatus Moduliflexus flocculans]|uniref:Response regulator containing CheY-like receiver n=1 Tax=Candidatus Moduliflexus flocculans TaxID=1499966 RepID=A0A081BLH1_9BACT|nr:response regulator containing CheY-like receiver [Candidatus Moduliflexus flocculans]GAK51237.1 response regulator containing CheY-like receiver [Candidatus Moduliflexus flocculans]